MIVIGALVPAIPWIIHYANKSEEECVKATTEFIKLTHPIVSLVPYIDIYARLLYRVLNGKNLSEEVQEYLSHKQIGGSSKKTMVEALLSKAREYVLCVMAE